MSACRPTATATGRAVQPRKGDVRKTRGAAAGGFPELVCGLVRVPNPQEAANGGPGEGVILEHVCQWLRARGIPHEADLSWGIHASLVAPAGAGTKPGVLLAGHLDSDHLHIPDLKKVALDMTRNVLVCPGQVGLDCKTGVAIALSVLERLQTAPPPSLPAQWQVHVLFTVGEESGQKGAIRAPLPRLLAGKVRLGVVVDRMTSGSSCPYVDGKPARHAVTQYKGVPLLAPGSGDELLRHLNAGVARATGADARAAAPPPLPTIESPNCADAIELRGRWDAEVLAPAILPPGAPKDGETALVDALQQYAAATQKVLARMDKVAPAERVSSMFSSPRMTRYNAMRRVYDCLHGGGTATNATTSRLAFSCVNLSYDYDDAWDEVSLGELDLTARILEGMIASYYEEGAVPAAP